jgi:hypothetical protein
MRRAIATFGLLSVLGLAASFIVLSHGASQADAVDATFIIPASDGYGIADCLTTGNACGVIVADAWCEAHGFSRAATFGTAVEEVTGATKASLSDRLARPIAITCAN